MDPFLLRRRNTAMVRVALGIVGLALTGLLAWIGLRPDLATVSGNWPFVVVTLAVTSVVALAFGVAALRRR